MRKILTLFLCGALLFSVTACGKNNTQPINNVENIVTENTEVNNSETNTQTNAVENSVTKEQAQEIALSHAEVQEPRFIEVSLDREHQGKIYEVDFEYEDYEYEYDIDATTGEILYNTKELDNEWFSVQKEVQVIGNITEDTIKKTVFDHAKVEEKDVQFLKIEKDFDDGRNEIDVEFRVGTMEYNYTLSDSGEILEFEVEND